MKTTYHFVSAGHQLYRMNGMGIYIRYKKILTRDIKMVKYAQDWAQLDLPDREVLIVRDLHRNNSDYPKGESWDELVCLTPGHSAWSTLSDSVKFLMLNAVDELKAPHRQSHLRKPGHERPDGLRWFGDSGGFQLASGRVQWVDPVDLAKFYNTNVDYGMALDIPISSINQPAELFLRTAKVHKKNNEIMLEHMPAKRLYNMIHGMTIPDFQRYHDIVHRDDVTNLAMADIYHGSLFNGLWNIHQAMEAVGKYYKRVHLLGVMKSSSVLPVLRYLIKKHPGKAYTSDASSPSRQTFYGKTYQAYDVGSSLEMRDRSLKGHKHLKESDPYRVLACSCPVCSSLKYVDVFARMTNFPLMLLLYHNIIECSRYFEQAFSYANTLDDKDWKKYLLSQCPKEKKYVEKVNDFCTALINDDKDIRGKFGSFLGRDIFGESVDSMDEGYLMDQQWLNRRTDELDTVITAYEKGKPPEKSKTVTITKGSMFNKTSKVSISTARKRAAKMMEKQKKAMGEKA